MSDLEDLAEKGKRVVFVVIVVIVVAVLHDPIEQTAATVVNAAIDAVTHIQWPGTSGQH